MIIIKILNFGSCNIDYVYSVDHIVAIGETETTNKLETFPGGKGLNQSIALARAGVDVYHAGCIGSDGNMLLDILKDSGVNTSYIKNVPEKNGHAIIQVSAKGDNSIFLYPGSNEMVTKEYVDSVLDNFSANDIVLLQNEISNIDYIINRAYEKDMCIILNPSPFNEKIKEIDFSMISFLILNEVEAQGISGCEECEESISFFKKNYPDLSVILTLGSNGSMFINKTHEVYQAAFLVDAVDTTAAGDTFTGYFISGIANDINIQETLKIASAASAIAVTKNGAAPSIPERKDVLASLQEFKLSTQNNETEIIRQKIETYIQKNIKNANLNELSSILGYSVVYTGNVVKRVSGKTFAQLLQNARCVAAADRLLNTNLSIKEIIEDIGYENESYFRKIFREKYGKNPLNYRKRDVK